MINNYIPNKVYIKKIKLKRVTLFNIKAKFFQSNEKIKFSSSISSIKEKKKYIKKKYTYNKRICLFF